jgi:hypothetical protein
MTMKELAERCCERPNLRTLFRGAAGCVEECQRCGFSFGYTASGELTDTTLAALRARASQEPTQ